MGTPPRGGVGGEGRQKLGKGDLSNNSQKPGRQEGLGGGPTYPESREMGWG